MGSAEQTEAAGQPGCVLRQKGECGEDVWPGGESDGCVGAESWGAVVFAGGVVTGGACVKVWTARCLALTGRSAAQSWSGGWVGGETYAASVVAPVVCDAQSCHWFVPHLLLRACPPHPCWMSEIASAPACLMTTPQSSASPGSARVDEGAGRGCNVLPPLPKPGIGAAAGAEWLVTGTEFGVWKSSVSPRRSLAQPVVG